jgi:hypothetical protein
MKKIWESLNFNKIDLTNYGHWSGTGLVDFSGQIEFELR